MPRTVVVTGGGTGIGRAIAIAFAAAGDNVIVTGRRPEPITETARLAGQTARAVVCDASDPVQVRSFAAGLTVPVDVLINNAGGNRTFDNPETASLEDIAGLWRDNFDANVLSAVLTTEALANRIADGGAVISIGSIAAERGAASYGAAKAALSAWNVSAAQTLGARGITCNVVAPGYIADTEFFRDRMTAERRSQLMAETLIGRVGEPDDITKTVAFLASPAARHITAQVLHVNGGAWTTR